MLTVASGLGPGSVAVGRIDSVAGATGFARRAEPDGSVADRVSSSAGSATGSFIRTHDLPADDPAAAHAALGGTVGCTIPTPASPACGTPASGSPAEPARSARHRSPSDPIPNTATPTPPACCAASSGSPARSAHDRSPSEPVPNTATPTPPACCAASSGSPARSAHDRSPSEPVPNTATPASPARGTPPSGCPAEPARSAHDRSPSDRVPTTATPASTTYSALPGDPGSGLVTIPLASEELVLATAPGGSRSAPADLSELSLVDFPPGWAIREAVDRAFPRRRVSLEVDDLAVAAGLVRAGLAACVLPLSATARFPDLTVRRFDRPPTWQLAAVHRGDPSAAVAALVAQLG
ncbi:LysR substrate-binding domain-containing protein [Amycolatopsis sp. NBC_01488]|nr:LysR substrate-binding domain-containing protein [Amycolatopsis sp. NBC_01488]